MIKIPSFCKKSVPEDSEGAGWYVHNSVRLIDIVPDFRLPGGGVTKEELTDLPTAIDKAISLTKQRINGAENHLRKLAQAKAGLDISAKLSRTGPLSY